MVHKLPEPPDVITGNVVGMTCESVYSHIDEIYDYDEEGDLSLLNSTYFRGNIKRLCNEGITLLWHMVYFPKSTPKEKFYASLGLLTCVNVNVTWAGARTLYRNKRKFDKTKLMLVLDPS